MPQAVTPGGHRFLAHGVGGPADLPIPAHYAFLAAAAALLVSFVVLAFAWREPRFEGDASGHPLPVGIARIVDSASIRAVVVVVGLLFAAWVTMAALIGKDTVINPTFGSVYVLLWVGLVPAALLFGPVYKLCNPLRWAHRGICRLAAIDPGEGLLAYPRRLGMWPGAFALFAFVWLELVSPTVSQSLTAIQIWFGLVAVLLLLGAMLFGDSWFAHADPFEVYSSVVARLSPFGRRSDGVLVVRNPLENLDGIAPTAGLVGVVSVLFGSTAFDSFKESSRWLGFSQQYVEHSIALNSAALLGFCLAVLASFTIASVATGVIGQLGVRRLPDQLAHSVVPIVVGYVVAHYLSFFVSNGLLTLTELGDPLSRGWTLTSWLDGINHYAIYGHPTAIAVTKVVAIVVGHVLGVVSAHDRSVRILPKRHAVRGQIPMLVLMVAYTLTGLWLLFST